MNHRKLIALLFFVPLGLVACESAKQSAPQAAEARVESVTVGSIRNVHEFGSYLLAGQPSPEDFLLLKQRGVQTVITLRTDPEVTEFDESAVVSDLGMHFAKIPFREPDSLTDDVFGAVRRELNEARRPVLMHCGSANRVGAVWIPWRVLDGGVSFEQALAEAREIGLSNAAYEAKARDYVQRHAH